MRWFADLTIFALRHLLFVSNKTSTDGTASCHSAIIHVAARHAGTGGEDVRTIRDYLLVQDSPY